MTAPGPTSFAAKWRVGVLLIFVAGVALGSDNAHSKECLAAPNSPAREGTWWYYRLDWATQRKCWYMRAIDPPTHQTTAHPEAGRPAPALATPIPRPGSPATGSAISVNRANPTPPSDTKTTAELSLGGPTPDTILKKFASQPAGPPLAAPASNTAPGIGTATDETTSAISNMHQAAPVTAGLKAVVAAGRGAGCATGRGAEAATPLGGVRLRRLGRRDRRRHSLRRGRSRLWGALFVDYARANQARATSISRKVIGDR
jgi:hypothetical protein